MFYYRSEGLKIGGIVPLDPSLVTSIFVAGVYIYIFYYRSEGLKIGGIVSLDPSLVTTISVAGVYIYCIIEVKG